MRSPADISHTIARLRKEQGMTLTELAGKLGIGKSALSRYERAERQVPVNNIGKYADALKVSIEYLLFTDEERRTFLDEKAVDLNEVINEDIPVYYNGKRISNEKLRLFVEMTTLED